MQISIGRKAVFAMIVFTMLPKQNIFSSNSTHKVILSIFINKNPLRMKNIDSVTISIEGILMVLGSEW